MSPNRPSGRWLAAALALTGIGGLAAVVSGCSWTDNDRTAPDVRDALTPPPASPQATGQRGFVGVLVPRDQVTVSSRAVGRLRSVNVRMGDRVNRGQSLAVVESTLLEDELAAVRATSRAAQADFDKAQTEVAQATDRLARLEKLADFSPQVELAEARFQRRTALAHLALSRATVAGAQARVVAAADTLRETDIRAPFDGAIGERYLDPGATVAVGTPIVRLISADDLHVRFAVPEACAGTLQPGLPITIDVAATGNTVRGAIATIAPEIDPALRALVVDAVVEQLPGAPARLAAGLEARVHLVADAGAR